MFFCEPRSQAIHKNIRPSRAEQLAQGNTVLGPHRCACADAAQGGIAGKHRDPCGARHAHAHGMLDATLAQGFQPRQHDVGIKSKLRDDQGGHAAHANAAALAFKHLPPIGRAHDRMAFRMPAYADNLDARALEN
ncbi:hypothetical protein G6F57_022305 [Rhizopus arrhizus]|nr:hypothetical protein G6F57_022305 [Rhizopus arrhizus]